jgi:dephospho-CoA kinase
MKVCGLTGGVGMGKTTTAQCLVERGVRLLDTDNLARDLVRPGEPALGEIQAAFGADIVGADGQLRREELARIVFADHATRQKLESILHPRIRSAWLAQIEIWRSEGPALAVVVIPLLFETGAQSHFDRIICVACRPETQRERLATRGWTTPHIAQRMAAQWPVEQKIARSDYVVWTEGRVESLARQVELILAGI